MLFWVARECVAEGFPPVAEALTDPDGLLAIGGDLTPERLLDAYRRGIFPWYSEGQPILWWSPDPRAVFHPDRIHVSRSLARRLRRRDYEVTCDADFAGVIRGCAAPREDQAGTWITAEMMTAYERMHALGHAHSVEVWHEGALAGGLYGISIGRAFFGESMFSVRTDASKVALANLGYNFGQWGGALIDCQVRNPHLDSLGAELLPRAEFVARLEVLCGAGPVVANWKEAFRMLEAPERYTSGTRGAP